MGSNQEEMVDDYIIMNELGRGGTSVVKLGLSKKNLEPYAIKLMKPNFEEDVISMVQQEFQIIKTLDHPNIIKLFDIKISGTHTNKGVKKASTPYAVLNSEDFQGAKIFQGL